MNESFEGKFIARIDRELEIGGHVLDVRLLEETDAARDTEWDVASREFELQFERVKMRAVKHRHAVQFRALFAQFEHALSNERCLFGGIAAGDQDRLAAGFPRGRKSLGVLVNVGGDRGVGDVENLRRAAVIGLDPVNGGVRIAVGKLENVFVIRPAPRVNALRVIAYHHHVVMPRGQQINQVALQLVRVLIFIDKDEAELVAPLDDAADVERNLLEIPRSAVREVGQVALVNVVSSGEVESRAVRLGASRDGKVEVLSGLFDRYPRLKIAVAHMGGGLLPVMGRLDFGWRLGCDGMPERAVIRCKRRPSDYLAMLYVDTMGFWAPHVREAVDVFGVDRVMFGTDYGPVPIDPKEHIDIVSGLAISPADKEKILWRNAARFFELPVAT